MADVVSDVIINYKSVGLDKVGSEIKQTSVALDGLVVSATSSEKATASLENRFKSLEKQLGTCAGNADKFAKVQDQVNKAVAQNPELQGRANEVLAAAAAKYGMVEKAAMSSINATKLGRYELINVSRQIQDTLVSLYSGQSPLTVLVQQGSQGLDILQASGVKAGDAFKQIGGIITGVLTPVRLLAGGVLGAAAAVAYFGVQWDNAQKEAERALIGIGQRTGTTVGDINNFAKANASATGLSISEARNAALEFTKTGDIAIAGLHGLGEAIHGYASLTGGDATEATKKLASAFSGDLAKGADELNKTYGFLDSATRKQIESLQLVGDRMGAVQIIIDKMAPSNIKAAEGVGVLTKAWAAFKNVISNITNGPTGQSAEDQLSGLKARLAELKNATTQSGDPTRGFRGAQLGGDRGTSDLIRQIDDLQKKIDSFKTESAQAQLRAMSTAGDAVVKSIIPQIDQIKNLELALKALQDAQNTPGVSRDLGADNAAVTAIQNQLALLRETQAEAARYNDRVAEISQSWGNVGQATALSLQSMQNTLPVAQAWTEAGRMLAQYQATYNNLLDQGKTKEEAAALAAEQYALAKAAAVASAQKLVQASEDNLDKIRAEGTGMEAVVASAIAYRDAIQAGATATQAAAIATNTLEASLIQAARAADKIAVDMANAAVSAAQAAEVARLNRSVFEPRTMPTGQLSFVADPNLNVSYLGGGRGYNMDVGVTPGASDLQQLYDARDAKARQDLEAMQQQQLTAMQSLTQATEANTAATVASTASLNPLYSEGHGALAIGYYHAASGLDMVAQGPTFGDTVPFHAMVNGGERIQITPASERGGLSGDDIPDSMPAWARAILLNAMRSPTTIVQNFDFKGVTMNNARRSRMQFAQGFGQAAAALK